MKHLNKDDKEFIAILLGIAFIIFGFYIAIFCTVRDHAPKKHYEMNCVHNYIKRPFNECYFKEVE